MDIGNGIVTFNGNSTGDMAAYACNSGFELIGNATTTCTLVDMDRAEFQPVQPSCRREHSKYKIISSGMATYCFFFNMYVLIIIYGS